MVAGSNTTCPNKQLNDNNSTVISDKYKLGDRMIRYNQALARCRDC